jgi:hypothetical protein
MTIKAKDKETTIVMPDLIQHPEKNKTGLPGQAG